MLTQWLDRKARSRIIRELGITPPEFLVDYDIGSLGLWEISESFDCPRGAKQLDVIVTSHGVHLHAAVKVLIGGGSAAAHLFLPWEDVLMVVTDHYPSTMLRLLMRTGQSVKVDKHKRGTVPSAAEIAAITAFGAWKEAQPPEVLEEIQERLDRKERLDRRSRFHARLAGPLWDSIRETTGTSMFEAFGALIPRSGFEDRVDFDGIVALTDNPYLAFHDQQGSIRGRASFEGLSDIGLEGSLDPRLLAGAEEKLRGPVDDVAVVGKLAEFDVEGFALVTPAGMSSNWLWWLACLASIYQTEPDEPPVEPSGSITAT